jgi:hypothetical protein
VKIRAPHPLWIFSAAAVLGVVAVVVRVGVSAYRQHQAIATIERLGGRVKTEEFGPDWLRERLGDERMWAFDRVWLVDLGSSSVTDGDLESILVFPDIKTLDLSNTEITDAGVGRVSSLTNLTALCLDGTNVTDAALLDVQRLTKLTDLLLSGTQVSDAGLVHLKDLHDLEYLSIQDARVTEQGLAELRRALPRAVIEGGIAGVFIRANGDNYK